VKPHLPLGDDPRQSEAGENEIAEALIGVLDKPAEAQQLSRQVETLKSEKAELENRQLVKLSKDVRGVLEESVDAKVDQLVEQAKLTPASADKLRASLKS